MKNVIFKILYFNIIIILLFTFVPCFADDEDDFLEENEALLNSIETSSIISSPLTLNSRACVVIDRQSQTIMFGKNEASKVKMASTTKIMTATVILENCDLTETVEVSKKAAGTGGSRLGLKTNDKVTIRDLLYGLLLCSGNDSAVALAEAASGSVQNFSILMNDKAKELGLFNTNFESPHGLDSTNHYTTAYELALLTNYALNNSTFLQIVGTKSYTVTINGSPKNIRNTNELLGYLNGVYGVKTGFTNGANRCLVTACKRGDMDIICVVLGCDTKKFRTTDSIKLIEYCFENFEYVNISDLINKKFDTWKAEHSSYFSVYKGVHSNLELEVAKLEHDSIPLQKNSIPSITFNIEVEHSFEAPLFPNMVIGNMSISYDAGFIANSTIFTTNEIPKKNMLDYFNMLFKEWTVCFFN